jgi:hypothetical protein
MSINKLTFIFILINIANSDKLIFVSTHFRHGARAPMKVDSNYMDHIKEKWTSPGELTAVGQRMHYILGLRNRRRYITDTYHFLSETFDSHEILVYSSAFNRTILSAYAQLQGLYPEDEQLGLSLNEKQEALAVPDIKYDYPEIIEKIKKIEGSSMPNLMTLIPVRMINDNEKKITLYDIGECAVKRDKIKEKNRKTLPIIIHMEKEFNDKYGDILNIFYEEEKTYEFSFMNRFCDGVISGITEARPLSNLRSTGINIEEIQEYCFNVQRMNYQEYILGDDEHILAPLESSKLMREIIHYMKKRIDIDINQEKIEEEYLDYSRPKMLMISGHDSTISCHEMFIITSLGYSDDFFRLAKYGAQLALEVTRKDAPIDQVKKMTYKDYTLNYYFNDELLFKLSVDEFIKKIEDKLWTDEQIDKFCGFKNSKDNNLNSMQLMIGIILSSLVLILAISTIVLSIKLINLNKKHKEVVSQISMVERHSVNDY